MVVIVCTTTTKEKNMKITPLQMATERFNIVGELNGYASEMIRELSPKIYKLTEYNPITIAQKGDLLMCNSGARTSVLNLKEMEKASEIMDMIVENVHKNARLNTTGRRLEYLG